MAPGKLPLLPAELLQETYELYADSDIHAAIARIRNATHYRMVFLDLEQFSDDTETICEALSFYRSLNPTPLILIAQGKSRGDEQLAALVDIGCYNFVTSYETAAFREQLGACISGRSHEEVAEYAKENPINKKKQKRGKLFSLPALSLPQASLPKPPSRKTKAIALAGVCTRIGVTTQAIRLTRALNEAGQRACYVEDNDHDHVRIIRDVFSDAQEQNEGLVDYAGVTLYYAGAPVPEGLYDYAVHDCGTEVWSPPFETADLQILVAGSAAWEMAALSELMQTPMGENVRYLFSFTGNEEREDILDFMAERWKDTYFAAFSPDMFAPLLPGEKEVFRKIL